VNLSSHNCFIASGNTRDSLTHKPLINIIYHMPISPSDSKGTNMLKEFFLGFVKIHILYHASKEPIYGAEILEELGRHGYRLSPGTLYPTLHRLSREGLLSVEKRIVDGKIRKYYVITEQGLAALDEAKKKITELVNEVILDR
jgi:PadR family transcriptional regulator PadR